MADMAYAEIRGHLAKDPRPTKTPKGCVTKLCVETVRDNTGVKDRHNMTAYNQIAENCAEYLKQGSYVKTKCKIVTFGNDKFYRTEFVINHIEFLDEEEIIDGQM